MATARITIRTAVAADLPAIEALERATFTAHAISPRQMRYLVRTPTAIFLVATKSGVVVGDGIGLVRRHAGGKIAARIYSVVVDAEHRGERIGQKLMSTLMAALHKRGAGHVSLEVEHTNVGAIRLYERLGFETQATLKHYYGRSKHGLRMRRHNA